MATLELNGKDLVSQTSTAEPVIASTVTGAPALALTNATGTMPTGTQDNITRLGTVTAGNLSNSAIVYPDGHIIQVVSDHSISGGAAVEGNQTATITGVLAGSTILGYFFTGQPSAFSARHITGGGLSSSYFITGSSDAHTYDFVDDNPSVGSNTYTFNLGTAVGRWFAAAGGYAYGYKLMEVAG